MKVIIPAAGAGSRLRPYTYTVPKTLLPVAGKPIISHIMEQIIAWGATSATIIYGHLGEQIRNYVEGRYSIKVDFRFQEAQLGLGHAIYLGLDDDDEDVLIFLGDTILDTDLQPVIKRKVTTIGVKEVADPRKLGVVIVEQGRVKKLIEKPLIPPSNLAIVGIYYIRSAALLKKAIAKTMTEKIQVKGEYQVTDALQFLLDWGERVETIPITGWFDCGKPETLLESNAYILQRDGGKIEDSIKDNSVIIPPVYIGEGTKIVRSVVGPNVSIGKNCEIQDTVISNSIVGEKAKIHTALLSRSLIGYRAEVSGRPFQINLGSSSCLNL